MTTRRWASWAAAAVERALGRRRMVRVARFLLNHARRDGPNDIGRNGERVLQRCVVGAAGGRELVVFDVGANVGQWSSLLLAERPRALSLHVFDPARSCAEVLRATLAPGPGVHIEVNQLALSSSAGAATLFKPHERAGSSSLHPSSTGPAPAVEEVTTTTFDSYCAARGIFRVDLLKVDAEGHDHHVLAGAVGMLERRAIELVQFEYNHRWIAPRHYLRDVFDLVAPYGYAIGKLTPVGVEWYRSWAPELETFIEGNYVAAQPGARRWLPSATWWPEEKR